jgi:AcrR family transcriptional regulator
MEAIAAKAKVATGTLYNYFASKSLLLLALFAQELSTIIEKGEVVLARESVDLQQSISELLILYTHAAELFPREVMREVVGVMFSRSSDEISEMMAVEMQLAEQLARHLRQCQERGALRSDIDCSQAAMMLYGMVMSLVMTWISVENIKREDLEMMTRGQVQLAVLGLSPR